MTRLCAGSEGVAGTRSHGARQTHALANGWLIIYSSRPRLESLSMDRTRIPGLRADPIRYSQTSATTVI